MKKRVISALLAAALLCALAPASFAAVSEQDVIMTVGVLGVMNGDEQGNLNLDRPVTRAEFAKMAVTASLFKDAGSSGAVSPYPDVPYTHWAAGYIKTAVDAGWIFGYLDGTYRPGNNITLEEGATILLRVLGYTAEDLPGAYPTAQLTRARSLDLFAQVNAVQGQTLTRRDAMYLFYNLLSAKTKTGQVYLTTLGHSVTPSGEVDLTALINENLKGPIIADGSWQNSLPFSAASAAYFRDGNSVSSAEIRAYDVVYWVEHLKTVYAYSGRVSGTISDISPSAAAPSAVTIAGRAYALETTAAAYALSISGSFKTGDAVTLLLGKDGGVAGVVGALSSTLYGVVTGTGTASYTENGGSVTRNTVTLTATDGNSYTYPLAASVSYSPGTFVQVVTNASGAAVTGLSTRTTSGRVSADGKKLGNDPFAGNVEILDVSTRGSTPSCVRIYPARLAGLTISSSQVRAFQKNSAGEITHLILNNVTGDMDLYGVVTKVSEDNSSMTASGSYAYDIGGVPGVFSSASKSFNISVGPAGFSPNGQSTAAGFAGIYNLTSVAITALAEGEAQTAQGTLRLADGVLVYEQKGSDYYLTSLSRVLDTNGFRLTGWYDAPESEGGRVRVVTAVAK